LARNIYGSPKITIELNAEGILCGKNRVARLMKENEIKSKVKKKYKVTTDSKHKNPVAENLLKRNFAAEKPDEKWVSDITYLWTGEGWFYLCVIIDLFSRQVVGWSVSKRMSSSLLINAFDKAYKKRKPSSGLIFHSDRGSQYASKAFRKVLKSKGLVQSMSRKGDCWDNAVAESFFSVFKKELIFGNQYISRAKLKSCIFEYIEIFYNRFRRHSYLEYLSPADFERDFDRLREKELA